MRHGQLRSRATRPDHRDDLLEPTAHVPRSSAVRAGLLAVCAAALLVLVLVLARSGWAPLDTDAAPAEGPDPLDILVLHEWFPVDTYGCDVRLERIVEELAALGQRVTFVARDSLGPASEMGRRRLARLLRGRVYLAADEVALESLLTRRAVDAVLLPVWFWRDRPVAELALPVLRHAAPLALVLLLSDDCHAVREGLLAALDPLPAEAARSRALALELLDRETHLQRAADRLLFISEEDRALCHYATEVPAGLLRAGLPPRAQLLAGGGWAAREGLVFVGNGPNPTNHLSIKHFVRHVWPLLRTRLPDLRLHLVGELPREGRSCRERGVHCHWTDGDDENQPGLVVHGRVAQLSSLLAARRLLVAPIVNSTGVNTKGLLAFQHALPLVCSAKAAAGLPLPANASDAGVLVAADDSPGTMAGLILAAYLQADVWQRLAAAARAHFFYLQQHDPLAHDVRTLLQRLEHEL